LQRKLTKLDLVLLMKFSKGSAQILQFIKSKQDASQFALL